MCIGGGPDTSGQNEAAKVSAEIAKQMWEEYQKVYLPMERSYAMESFNYDTERNREEQAGKAAADVSGAFEQQRASSARDMAAMGIDPSSGAWADKDSKLRLGEAAAMAGAKNAARTNVENMGFARKQDAISIGKGMPGTAASSMANSGSMYGQIASNQIAQDNANSSGIANTIGGAAALKDMWPVGAKDGGYVEKGYFMGGTVSDMQDNQPQADQTGTAGAGGQMRRSVESRAEAPVVRRIDPSEYIMRNYQIDPRDINLRDGGHVKESCMAAGGLAGNPRMMRLVENNAASAGVPVPQGKSPLSSVMSAAQTGKAAQSLANALMPAKSAVDASLAATAAPAQTGLTAALAPATEVGAGATSYGLGTAGSATGLTAGASTGAGLTVAPLATSVAAAPVAAGAGASGLLGTMGAALASNPVGWAVGAGLLLNEMFKADGGPVRKNMVKGGKVDGNGTGTSDSIPARLSDGEYVINAESVKMVGKDVLDKINAAGLARRYGVKGVMA